MGYRGKIGKERREGRSRKGERRGNTNENKKERGEERFENREGQRTEIKIIISPCQSVQLYIYLFQILKKLGYMH